MDAIYRRISTCRSEYRPHVQNHLSREWSKQVMLHDSTSKTDRPDHYPLRKGKKSCSIDRATSAYLLRRRSGVWHVNSILFCCVFFFQSYDWRAGTMKLMCWTKTELWVWSSRGPNGWLAAVDTCYLLVACRKCVCFWRFWALVFVQKSLLCPQKSSIYFYRSCWA